MGTAQAMEDTVGTRAWHLVAIDAPAAAVAAAAVAV